MTKNRRRITSIAHVVVLLGSLLSRQALADDACPPGNLLAGRLPRETAGVLHPDRLSDGVAANEGDDWQIDLVGTIGSHASLTYDLGRVVRARSVFLQGDHAGPYVVESSLDGRRWFELWRTPPAESTGLRSRVTSALNHDLRFLRVPNPRPSGAFGLTELQLACAPADAGATVRIREGAPDLAAVKLRDRYRLQQAGHKLIVGLLGGIGFISLLLAGRRVKPSAGFWPGFIGAGALLLYTIVHAARQQVDAERWLQLVGIAAAAIAMALAAAGAVRVRRRPLEDGRTSRGTVGAAVIGGIGAGLYALATGLIYGALHWAMPVSLAVLAAAYGAMVARRVAVVSIVRRLSLIFIAIGGATCATNFGTFFQWRDVVAGIGADAELNLATSWGPVLYHDQFHYYLGSKYFPELRYHLLYDCAALAELDNGRGAAITKSRIRNLRDNRMEPGSAALSRADECRTAFTPDRWEEFRRDVGYFRARVERSGAERYLTDHGYNATPFWTAMGRAFASPTAASDRSTKLLALLDVAFLAGCLVLIAWAFAPEAAALAALVWGVGQMWFYVNVGGFGSFNRFDWLFAAVAGVCLLRKGMARTGGLALVASSLLRVFPGAFLFGPGVRGLNQLVRERRLDPELRRILIGAVAGLAALVPVSILGTTTRSHAEFVQNAVKHAETPLSNYMGLRTMFSWDAELRERMLAGTDPDDQVRVWTQQRDQTFGERRVWYVLAAATLIGLTILLGLRSSQSWLLALAGVVPMFCLFELTNYFYAVMAMFAVWAYGDARRSSALLGLALAGTVVFLHLQWRALAYVVNSGLVLAFLAYFLGCTLLGARTPMAAADAGFQPGLS